VPPPSSPVGANLRFAPDGAHRFLLDEVEHFSDYQRASVASLRPLSPSSRNAVQFPSGMVFSFAGIPKLLRQGDAKVFKKYSQMKLQMKREALKKLNRKANEGLSGFDTERLN
jgi:hypothetical protein